MSRKMPTFAELIHRKEQLLLRLAPVSVRQLEIVRNGDVSLLVQLLGAKQQLMYDFETIERQLEPFKDLLPEQRVWSSEAERRKTGESVDRCAALLEEILRNDNMSIEELATRKDEVEEQLRKTRQGAQIHNGYAKQAKKSGIRHFDKKS